MNEFNIKWFDELDSTNEHLKKAILQKELASETVFVAKNQTAGKGRKQRGWLSKAGKNLTFSVLIKTTAPAETLSSITLTAGLAVAKALQSKNICAKVKWPNDVMVEDKKVCGILTELVGIDEAGECRLILGIGINVNMNQKDADNIDKPTTSLSILTKNSYNLPEILDEILAQLKIEIQKWKAQGFASIKNQWKQNCVHTDQLINITNIKGNLISGLFDGVSDLGELTIITDCGNSVPIIEGDISY